MTMTIAEPIMQLHHRGDHRSDEALTRAAQSGDVGAASALIERYYPRVYWFVYSITHGKTNVEDLTQEVFTRALGALPRFNGSYRLEAWLLRIARNLVIDDVRKRVRLPEPTDPTELMGLGATPSQNDDVWEVVCHHVDASVVNLALSRLPARQRTVLVLRELEGMSYAHIAKVVGINARGVESALRRARARFRIELGDSSSAEGTAQRQATLCP